MFREQFLSSDWPVTVHFAVTFQTKTEQPLYFLITLLSHSSFVTIMKQLTLSGHPAVKQKTSEGVTEAGWTDPKVV